MFELTTQLLRQQLEVHARAWSQGALDEMSSRQLEAQLRIAIGLHRALVALHDDFGTIPHPGQASFDYAKAMEIEGLYRLWDVPSRMIWKQVKQRTARGENI